MKRRSGSRCGVASVSTSGITGGWAALWTGKHFTIWRSGSPRRQIVKCFPVQSAAQPPVIPEVETEATPQRDPLRRFIDVVGPDLPAREFLIVRRARLDRHRAVEKKSVPVVVDVGGAAERLVLSEFIRGCEHVLVQSERVLAVSHGA